MKTDKTYKTYMRHHWRSQAKLILVLLETNLLASYK